jgi:replicative DNA helicase
MDKIFKYFIIDGKYTIQYISWFVECFPVSEFSGINKVLYLFLEYCSTLGIVAKRKYLEIFLKTDLKKLVREYNIRLDLLTANYNYDEIAAFAQAVQTISTTCMDTFDAYSSEIDTEDNFKVLMTEFINNNLKDRIQQTFQEQFVKMNQGYDMIDVAEETTITLDSIRDIYNMDILEDLDFLIQGESLNKDSSKDKARLIAKTGIPAIDNDYGGIFSKALITMAGQPGSGKTRFLLAIFVYMALVRYKVGVYFDELELQDYEIRNILVSVHIANLYKIKIPDRDINRDDLSDEQKKIVASARIDLFESGKYGRFILHAKADSDVIVEKVKNKMLSFLKLNRDIQIWCVDYIGLVVSNPANKYERLILPEIIDKMLRIGKKIAKKADIAVIFINQYNDEGNKAAFAGKPVTVGMIQGGQAVQRHSDYDLAMTYTEEQQIAGLRMLSTTKDRASVGFRFVPVQTDLAISRFTQINKLEQRG